MPRFTSHAERGGQAVVLLLGFLVALAALTLWVGTAYRHAAERLALRDGGDAAALAAARWQAAGLNLVGELNLIQAYMLADAVPNAHAARALHELRQRVALAAPFLALLSASETARANGLPEIPECADFLREIGDEAAFNGLFPGAEEAFRDMAHTLAAQPLHAAPASPGADPSGHLLLAQDFYEAVLADDWCWFWFNAYPFLQRFSGRADFGPLPDYATEPFLGLRLGERLTSLEDLLAQGVPLDTQLADLGHPTLPPPAHGPAASDAERRQTIPWSAYDAGAWGPWEAMRPGGLPITGTLRGQYDYFGASAPLSVADGAFVWLAVAKPFGEVGGANPTEGGLVLGGFDDVRLIPVDAGDVGLVAFNPAWLRHIRRHLPDYSATGLTFSGCRYCSALRTFANPAWRARGLAWLARFGHTCRRPRADGDGGDSGGAHYGH